MIASAHLRASQQLWASSVCHFRRALPLVRRCSDSRPAERTRPELTLFTKTPCPLCEEALEALAPVLHQVRLRKVDITLDENKEWYKKYRFDIPVFHFEGQFLMKHRGNVQKLTEAVECWKSSQR